MSNTLFVVWRESLEAFLIMGILYAWLSARQDDGRGRRALFAGLLAGIGLALLLGWALLRIQDELAGEALEIFQLSMLLVATALITQMVLWMRQHGRQMKNHLHEQLGSARQRSGYWGVAVVAALAVAREGAETVIFLYGVAQSGDLTGLVQGALIGLAAAALTAWLAAKSLAWLNIGLLLRLSSVLLLVLASALLVTATDRLIGIGWLPPLIDPLWDSSALLDDSSQAGKMLADLAGYRARPSLSSLIVWLAYWGLAGFFWRRTSHG